MQGKFLSNEEIEHGTEIRGGQHIWERFFAWYTRSHINPITKGHGWLRNVHVLNKNENTPERRILLTRHESKTFSRQRLLNVWNAASATSTSCVNLLTALTIFVLYFSKRFPNLQQQGCERKWRPAVRWMVARSEIPEKH